jgi:hypothetical protein
MRQSPTTLSGGTRPRQPGAILVCDEAFVEIRANLMDGNVGVDNGAAIMPSYPASGVISKNTAVNSTASAPVPGGYLGAVAIWGPTVPELTGNIVTATTGSPAFTGTSETVCAAKRKCLGGNDLGACAGGYPVSLSLLVAPGFVVGDSSFQPADDSYLIDAGAPDSSNSFSGGRPDLGYAEFAHPLPTELEIQVRDLPAEVGAGEGVDTAMWIRNAGSRPDTLDLEIRAAGLMGVRITLAALSESSEKLTSDSDLLYSLPEGSTPPRPRQLTVSDP